MLKFAVMVGLERLSDMNDKFRLYGVCGDCIRMERLNVPKLIHELGAETSIGAVGPKLLCRGCGSRSCGVRIVWTGGTDFAYR